MLAPLLAASALASTLAAAPAAPAASASASAVHEAPAVHVAPAVHAVAAVPAAPTPVTEADLAPALTGRGAEGQRAFEARRFDEAARLLGGSDRPEARYLRALAFAEAGRHAEALAATSGLEEALPDLADRVRFLRGQELVALHRNAAGAEAFAAVADGSVLAPEARIARARALEGSDRAAALEALVPVLGRSAPQDLSRPDLAAPALLLAGRLRAAPGPGRDVDGARRALIECWAAHPMTPEAGDCQAALRALPGEAGAAPGPEDQLRRAEALLGYNRNDAAIALLRPLLRDLPEAGPGEAFACGVRAALGRAERKERHYAPAIELLGPVAERCDDAALRARALYVLAGAVAASGDRGEAIALYRRFARFYPTHAYADDALFLSADLLARDGKTAEAAEALGEVARLYPKGDYKDEARFKLAWLAKRAGDADAAIAQLLAIEEAQRDVDPYEHARAAYWRARLLASKGDGGREAARVIWAELARRYPADYYGLLSRTRLDERGAADGLPAPIAAPAPEPARYDPGPLREDSHFRAGVALLRLGLHRQAADELAAVDRSGLQGDAVLLLADVLDRAGDPRSAHQLLRVQARAQLRRAPEGPNLRVWRIAYPPAFRDQIRRWAPGAGVPIDLLQALMREESALDPKVISPAGAIGLTQLMLPTAQSVARRIGMPRPGRAALMQPPVNIRIGAQFLGDLLRRFDGSVALALAAYNAGGGAVGRWLGNSGDLALDEFVEEIPIEETRGYVKRVLRSFAAYRLLYGRPVEEALSLGQKLPGS
jgi:soluble lytic murein transglycosylase